MPMSYDANKISAYKTYQEVKIKTCHHSCSACSHLFVLGLVLWGQNHNDKTEEKVE